MKKYTTISGDTFDLIAHKALGSTRYTELLINENRAHVATVIFKAGVVLTLPTIIKEERAAKLPPWRR